MSIYVGLDFDDVILATFQNVRMRVKETARILSLPFPTDSQIEESYDYADEMVRKLYPADADRFLSVFNSLNTSYQPVDGAIEAIEYLAQHNKQFWMFTGARPRKIVEARLAQIGINPARFCRIIAKDTTYPYRKPHEAAWETCLKELTQAGIDTELYVDDDIRNYREARKRGFGAALLLGSPNSRGYEACVPPEDVLVSMRSLPEFMARRGLLPVSSY